MHEATAKMVGKPVLKCVEDLVALGAEVSDAGFNALNSLPASLGGLRALKKLIVWSKASKGMALEKLASSIT